jgi:Xaa-Pro dipeptidase
MNSKGIGGSDAATELAQMRPWAEIAPAISAQEFTGRIARARTLMEQAGAEALLVDAGPSLRYFTGLSWGASERLVAMLLLPEGIRCWWRRVSNWAHFRPNCRCPHRSTAGKSMRTLI